MTTGEGGDPRDGQAPRGEDRRGERIGVGGGDDSVSRIQLAARWAEAYGAESDSLSSVLKRFRTAYEYLDAVVHGIEPPDLEPEPSDQRPTPNPVPAYSQPAAAPAPEPPPAWASPTSQEPGTPPAERERPWP